ncbi:hypothetical protein AYO38_11685 [bacterium SCGC AG-212-C10]|nr:hypothetical protein AYO38_11685 [bacterium SCGC AG-212-C10]
MIDRYLTRESAHVSWDVDPKERRLKGRVSYRSLGSHAIYLLAVSTGLLQPIGDIQSLQRCAECGTFFLGDRRRLRGDTSKIFCSTRCGSRQRNREWRLRKALETTGFETNDDQEVTDGPEKG